VIVVVEALEDRAVDQRTFNVVASVIFALVALLHLLRIYMGWPIVIGSWTAPMCVRASLEVERSLSQIRFYALMNLRLKLDNETNWIKSRGPNPSLFEEWKYGGTHPSSSQWRGAPKASRALTSDASRMAPFTTV
jgi:hypothetical protein